MRADQQAGTDQQAGAGTGVETGTETGLVNDRATLARISEAAKRLSNRAGSGFTDPGRSSPDFAASPPGFGLTGGTSAGRSGEQPDFLPADLNDTPNFEVEPGGSGSATQSASGKPRLLDAPFGPGLGTRTGSLTQQAVLDPETAASAGADSASHRRPGTASAASRKPDGSATGGSGTDRSAPRGHWTSSRNATSTGEATPKSSPGSSPANAAGPAGQPGSAGQPRGAADSSPAKAPASANILKSIQQARTSAQETQSKQPGIEIPDDPPPIFKTRRRWGVPNQTGRNALEHDIDLTIKPGEVAFDGRYRVIQRPDWTMDDLINQSIEALDNAACDWGHPPGAFYWAPNVKLKTQPGGEAISRQLIKTLTDLGVSAKEVPQ